MRHHPTICAALAVGILIGASGCSDALKENEAVAEELIATMNDCAAALESIKDEASADAAAPKIVAVAERLESIVAKQKKLPKLTKSQDEAMMEKYKPKLQKAAQRMAKANFAVMFAGRKSKALKDALERLKQAGRNVSTMK